MTNEVELKWVSEENDSAWQTRKILRFRPNQKLPGDVIQTLKRDFPVVNGVLSIECNEATAPYIEMKFARPDFRHRDSPVGQTRIVDVQLINCFAKTQ